MRPSWRIVFSGILSTAIVLHSSPVQGQWISPERIVADIKVEGLRNNLWHLNKIARENGGNRAFGLPGFAASRDYVLERVRRFKTIDSWTQSFTEWFTQTLNITLTVSGDIGPIDIVTFTGATSTPNRQPITAPLLLVPINDVNGTGCLDSDYSGVNATGKILIIKRGICTFGAKAKRAKQKGAVGALIWNNVATPVTGGTLGPKDDYAPVGLISLADGQKLADRLSIDEELEATLWVDAIAEDRETWNVIAETKGGDPENVIVLGAHLDSVQEGPGINDDGSGSTALLELVSSVKKYKVKNKVRFIWWGAEESGLLGSFHYTRTLKPEQVANIALYLNFDMIGSPDAFYGVFDGDGSTHGFLPAPGSAHIEKLFVDFLSSPPYNLEITPAAFSNGSDYVGFVDLHIPVGGLFTGTPPQDNCYHLPCDDINNINWKALQTNTKAAGHVLATYALDLSGIPNREERLRRGAGSVQRVAEVEKGHSHGGVASCEHHEHTYL